MPIYKKYVAPHNTHLFVWHITEDEATLREGVQLTKLCVNRLGQMKSVVHRRGFLSVRQLLKIAGYTPNALSYDSYGKPHLADGKYISISHSHQFSTVAVGDSPLGVDIEWERPKVHRIASKFLHPSEMTENATDRFRTSQWCIKEAAYKALGKKGISFHDDIRTSQMDTENPLAAVAFEGKTVVLKNWLYFWQDYSCALAIKTE
jgi:4'-phosphopantetheinyl transferase